MNMTAKKCGADSAGRGDDSRTAQRRRAILAVVLVLVLAALIRVIYFLQYKAQVPYYLVPISDSEYYDQWALRVAASTGYGRTPFYMAPLYPTVLGIIYAVFGHKVMLVHALQAVLGLANLFLVYLIGKRLFGHRSGLAAMILLLFYAPLMFLESKLLTETLAVALNLSSLLALIIASERRSCVNWLVAGVLFGLSILCRPIAVLTAVLILAWLSMSGPKIGRLSRILLLAIGMAVVILPVTIRNYVIGGEVVPISTNGGIVFAQGNHPSASGLFSCLPGFTGSVLTQQREEMWLAEQALGHPVSRSQSSAYWFRYGLNFGREKPLEFLRLQGRKVLWSVHNRESPCNYNFYLEQRLVPVLRFLPMTFSLILGLAVFGFIRARRENIHEAATPVALFAVSVFLGLIVFTVSSRFRVPSVVVLAVFAGFGIIRIIDAVVARESRTIVRALGCVLPILLISLAPYPFPKVTGDALANVGAAYLVQGRTQDAVKYLNESLRVSPEYAYASLQLGIAQESLGNPQEALRCYAAAIRSNPQYADAYYHMGLLLSAEGRFDAAAKEFSSAIRFMPDYAAAHCSLGNALSRMGKTDEAAHEYMESIRECMEAVKTCPGDADAHFNLGAALDSKGDMPQAMNEYRSAIAAKSGYGEAHANLAIDLYISGKYRESWQEVILARKYGCKPNPDFLKALSSKLPEPK